MVNAERELRTINRTPFFVETIQGQCMTGDEKRMTE